MYHSPVSPITWQLKQRTLGMNLPLIIHSPVSPITWQLKLFEEGDIKLTVHIHQYHQLPGN